MRSSAVQVADVDFYQVALAKKKVQRLETVVGWLRTPRRIYEREIQGFKIVAERGPYAGAGELKSLSRRQISFKNAMDCYARPYEFLRELLLLQDIPENERYRYFAKVTYRILNRDGFAVSGGERSEFRLLQEISDAQHYDMLLIDEPESSFDNSFLRESLNSVIREIAKTMPVIVVTHNSTVAITVAPDYILFANKVRQENGLEYKVYCGHPTDKRLVCGNGSSISNHNVVMNSLEAGEAAYNERRKCYEAIED